MVMTKTYHKRNKLINGYKTINHPLYTTYNNMKQRCIEHPNYGGRGIKIDPEWDTFENFANDMYPTWTPGLTIERKNNNGNYNKLNCTWATRTEQCLNRRTFKNNKLNKTGVFKKNNRYIAKYNINHTTYHLGGSFTTIEDATTARNIFIKLLNSNKNEALKMLERPARYDSTTKIKGLSKSPTVYIVRITHNKERIYIGHFKKISNAIEALNVFKKTNNIK